MPSVWKGGMQFQGVPGKIERLRIPVQRSHNIKERTAMNQRNRKGVNRDVRPGATIIPDWLEYLHSDTIKKVCFRNVFNPFTAIFLHSN